MVKDAIKALAFLKDVKDCFSGIFDRKKEDIEKMKSYEQYMVNSCNRELSNNATLSNVNITYTFKDNPEDRNVVALDVEYLLEGSASDKLNCILFCLSMKENSRDNFFVTAYDCAGGKEQYVEIERESLDNGLCLKIPFFNREVFHMEEINTKIFLRWKRFNPVNDVMTLIIDPRNYSKNTKKVTITVKNEATNFDIEYINLEEYNRNTRKLDGSGVRQIYSVGNRIDNNELVKTEDVLKNGMNENAVFLMKVKC